MGGWDPRHDAETRIGRAARVLEPSPGQTGAPWFADDPLEQPFDGAVLPFSEGPLTWDGLAAGDSALAEWTAERWLGAWRRLPTVPDDWVACREDLHRLAAYVISPVRRAANGKIGLRYTYRGFGTPFFDGDRQVRIEGTDLVTVTGAAVERGPVGSLREAADRLGIEPDLAAAEQTPDLPRPGDLDRPLRITPEGAAFLSDWFGFAYSVLEELRAEAAGGGTPSRVQIWPEHFDAAFDFGDDAEGTRAGYGCSPGDGAHPSPYVYALPWAGLPDDDPFWITEPFRGARLGYAQIAAMGDQRAGVLAFLREARERIVNGASR